MPIVDAERIETLDRQAAEDVRAAVKALNGAASVALARGLTVDLSVEVVDVTHMASAGPQMLPVLSALVRRPI